MSFQAAVQGRARELRNAGLEGVEAAIQRQQCMPAERDDHGLLLRRQNGGAGLLGTHGGISGRGALAPFLDDGGADVEALGEGPYASLL